MGPIILGHITLDPTIRAHITPGLTIRGHIIHAPIAQVIVDQAIVAVAIKGH